MSIRYLDLSGAVNFWTNIKNYILSKIPTKTSELTNDSGFLTQHQSLSNYVTLNSEQTITGKKLFTNSTTKVNSVNTFTGSTQFIDLSTTVPRGAWPSEDHRVGRVYIGDNTSYNGAWFIVDPTITSTKAYYRMVTTNPDNTDSTRFSITWDSTKEGARCRKNVSQGDILPSANNTYNLGADDLKWDIGYIHNLIGSNKENASEDANNYYSTTSGSHMTFYTTTNGGTKLSNVPAAVNTQLESRTIRYLSTSDWNVEQICHNTNGLYYRKGNNNGWGNWKTFAFTDSNITGTAANVTGTVAIANGGTGATSRLSAIKNLTNESVGTPTHFLAITTNYAKAGYTTVAQAKTVLGITGDMGSHSDSEYVHKTGDESITGTKTFGKGTLIVDNSVGSNVHGEIKFNGSRPGYIVADNASDGVFDNAGSGISILLQDSGKPLHIGGYKVDSNGRVFADNTNKNPILSITSNLIKTSTLVPENDTVSSTFRILSQLDYANGDTSKVLDVRFTQYDDASASSVIFSNADNKTALGGISRRWRGVYATNYYYGADNVEFSSKFVTSDTTQTISGAKTFSSTITGDLTGTASKATSDANGREISTGYMWRGSYERIVGTNEEHKDLNTYQDAGFYNVKTALVDNCPSGIGTDAVLLVYPWNHGNYSTQEITEAAASSNARRWIRKCNNNTWSDWKQIAFTTDDISGNASTATEFSANKSVTLTGDVTGSASSKAGWSVSTTLSNSGVTAGTYGPSEDVTGNNNATISVPEITVDSKGRVTSVTNRTLTCKNNTYNVYNKTLTIQKNGTNVATFTSNSNTNVTANITVPTKTSELTNDSNFLTTSSSLNASKLTGTIDIARLPQGALERVITVADQTARFALTTSSVQLGDTVKQLDTGVMYVVVDESKLNSNDGYLEYTAGSASSVPWSGITSKPTEFTPSSHTHTKSEITDFPTNVSAFTNDSGYLTSHQSLSNYVTLNTAQEITNAKTFKDANTVRKLTSVEAGNVIPTSDKLISDIWQDKNGKELGRIYYYKNKNGSTALCLRAGDWFTSNEGVYTLDASGTNRRAELHLYSDSSGNCCIKPVGYFSATLKPLSSSVWLGESTNPFGSVYANQFRMSNPSLEPNVDVQTNEEHSIGFFGKNSIPLSYITFQKRTGLADRVAIRIQTASSAYKSYCFDANCLYPEADNSLDIGSSSKIFKNIYCNNYYKGTTAFGDIVTHNASEFLTSHQSLANYVTTNTSQSISGIKTFPTNIDLANTSTSQREYWALKFSKTDTNGTGASQIGVYQPSNSNDFVACLRLGNPRGDNKPTTGTGVNTGNCWSGIGVYYNYELNRGYPYAPSCTSWSDSSNSALELASTEWVRRYCETTKNFVTNSSLSSASVASASEFSTNKDVTLTGDVTGTVSSKAGWTVSTTLANSGVTAGTYGPSADVTGSNNATISVPEITVDAKGRITSVTNRTYTSVNTDNDKKVYQYYKSDDNVYRLLFSNNAGNTATSNVGAVYSGLNNSFYVNPSTGALYATKLYSNGVEVLTSHQSLSSCLKNSVTNNQIIKSTGITRGTAPSSAQTFGIAFSDNNNKSIGNIYGQYATDKSTYVGLYAYKGTTTSNGDNASVRVGYDASGNAYTYAPTPATADNSTQIATTAFVKAQGYLTSHQSLANYVTTNTDQSISGIKSHSKHISILGDYVGNESSTNGRSCLYLKANRDTDGKSGLYVTKFRQNVAQGSMGSSDVVFLSHDILENETRTNAGFVESYSNWEDDVPKGISVYSTIATRNLGTSAKPWTNAYAVNIYENGTALSSKYALNENFGKGTTTYLYIKSSDFPSGSGSAASIHYNDVVDGTKLYVWYSVCNSSSILDINPTAAQVTTGTGQVWRYLGPTIYASGLGPTAANPTGILGLFRRES